MINSARGKNEEMERERLEPGSSGASDGDAGRDPADLKRKTVENGDKLGSRKVKFKPEDSL